MSEYQCYEFVALDRLLTAKQMAELRAGSTRAEISPTRFWKLRSICLQEMGQPRWRTRTGDPPLLRNMNQLAPGPEDRLYERIAAILDEARSRVARTINTAMVHSYWLVGREIVEVEQGGKERAEYGEGLMKRVAARLSARFGKGFSLASLKRMKQFYLAFPSGSALVDDPGRKTGAKSSTASSLSGEAGMSEKGSTALSLSASTPAALFPPMLAWSHYLVLLRVPNDQARSFYEIEAAREGWSVRELERQIGSLLFERLSMNRDKEQVLALARRGQEVAATISKME